MQIKFDPFYQHWSCSLLTDHAMRPVVGSNSYVGKMDQTRSGYYGTTFCVSSWTTQFAICCVHFYFLICTMYMWVNSKLVENLRLVDTSSVCLACKHQSLDNSMCSIVDQVWTILPALELLPSSLDLSHCGVTSRGKQLPCRKNISNLV